MDVAGVTGTNGKTTTAWLLERVLTACGATAGLIGTVAHRFGETQWPALHTTPEADDLARRLAAMRDQGAAAVVMEVSSHALSLSRVEAVRYRAAGFTNLTQDHLDFHGTLDAYVAAKRRLFTDLSPAVAVLNVDDPVGAEFARLSTNPVTLSARGDKATLRVLSGGAGADGVDATVDTPEGAVALRSPLRGAHNVENLLLVLGMAWGMGVPYARAAEAVATVDGAPGRLERVAPTAGDLGFDVLVDYAHTPDALARVLATLRLTTRGRIVCVFGCGGDRDRGKRPLMGAAVARGADYAVLTSDNPRSEDPARITADAEPGLRDGGARYEVVIDRREAIARAVALAREGDVVLVAGKGHETYQEVRGQRSAFDDRVEARAALDARVRRGG
ncbi:MAG: UDP-N-acetylmuramoyl-L-alanyl-D-glutamate--2,6-diaminopimelate ligase [Polyangiales bacterium]